MNSQTEERLRAAFGAKAEQVTAERLDQLATQRQQSLAGDLADPGCNSTGDSTSAFRISADTELGDDLPPLDAGHGHGAARHARWFAPLLAAAAVVALAVGVIAISARNSGPHRPNNSAGLRCWVRTSRPTARRFRGARSTPAGRSPCGPPPR